MGEPLADVTVSFDDAANIRVFDHEKFENTGELRDECRDFASKVGDFTENVQTFVQVLDAQAKIIEKEKLRAIGQRNLVDAEIETRKQKQRQRMLLLQEREAELERLETQLNSLAKVEADQLALIEKLSNNELN
ncbi:Intraflagellar transport protein 20-like [Hondaea fermentalgiana]|uniref:Intraflagellar transport protein 20-like n=1 Tax=Hondaea fermentalgiana TaxID=2315210 RepID=A0A2R5G1D1_9STRA|nr:Intraflagellar transport protein 20-like [Hondaea fermentalgiana]|eukprot:GBG24335.1 Intraflagellar transport protein 20-like [Hondaea fermentalgiana]